MTTWLDRPDTEEEIAIRERRERARAWGEKVLDRELEWLFLEGWTQVLHRQPLGARVKHTNGSEMYVWADTYDYPGE